MKVGTSYWHFGQSPADAQASLAYVFLGECLKCYMWGKHILILKWEGDIETIELFIHWPRCQTGTLSRNCSQSKSRGLWPQSDSGALSLPPKSGIPKLHVPPERCSPQAGWCYSSRCLFFPFCWSCSSVPLRPYTGGGTGTVSARLTFIYKKAWVLLRKILEGLDV